MGNMTRKERFEKFIAYFSATMPEVETELHYKDPYQLLVAVILSAQCTDKRVNSITPAFFVRFPDVYTLAKATEKEVFRFISSCSYPNNKAKYLVGMARMVVEKYNGTLPDSPVELQKIPGVGRKTAHVMASVLFNQPVLAVDTHVFRVASRLGLTYRARNPLQTERQLVKYIPESLIPKAHHWLILHGRYICQARKPKCDQCGLTDICRYYNLPRKQVN
jgi:endonuclease-3